jgi:phosphohistidine swiveling domain-containing protein
VLRGEANATAFRPGEVIVAPYPVNWIAPLLWGASGLITTGGSPAAHLVEVARWLKVPAVVHCDLSAAREVESGMLAAVDGDRGAVAVLAL